MFIIRKLQNSLPARQIKSPKSHIAGRAVGLLAILVVLFLFPWLLIGLLAYMVGGAKIKSLIGTFQLFILDGNIDDLVSEFTVHEILQKTKKLE